MSLIHCRNLKKAEEKVKSLLEEIEENKQDIENLEKVLGKLEEEATSVLEAYQESQVGIIHCIRWIILAQRI